MFLFGLECGVAKGLVLNVGDDVRRGGLMEPSISPETILPINFTFHSSGRYRVRGSRFFAMVKGAFFFKFNFDFKMHQIINDYRLLFKNGHRDPLLELCFHMNFCLASPALSPHSNRTHRLVPTYTWSETRVCPITTAVHCIHGQGNKGGKPRSRRLK